MLRVHHAIQNTLCIMDNRQGSDDFQVKRDRLVEKQLQNVAGKMLDDMLATVTSKALK